MSDLEQQAASWVPPWQRPTPSTPDTPSAGAPDDIDEHIPSDEPWCEFDDTEDPNSSPADDPLDEAPTAEAVSAEASTTDTPVAPDSLTIEPVTSAEAVATSEPAAAMAASAGETEGPNSEPSVAGEAARNEATAARVAGEASAAGGEGSAGEATAAGGSQATEASAAGEDTATKAGAEGEAAGEGAGSAVGEAVDEEAAAAAALAAEVAAKKAARPRKPKAPKESGEGGEGAGMPSVPGQRTSDEGSTPPLAVPADELKPALEAILMVVDEPASEIMLSQVLDVPAEDIGGALIELSAAYTQEGRGFDLRRAAGGWRFYTRADYSSYVERFVLDGQQLRLTQASLETLAVVAYKQPVTRSRISAIRGVNCDGVIRTLVTRGMIEECGSEPESGAHLYRTTNLFLEKLGLNSVEQLPPLAPFLPDNIDEMEAA